MIVKLTFLVSNKYIFIFNKYLVGKYSTKYLYKINYIFFQCTLFGKMNPLSM